ncbi:MAG: hypothetical protein IJ017_01135 [Oscillospiraceae bacterium]|nr:hypothetical protein [Oscillospiraceae bacterium]
MISPMRNILSKAVWGEYACDIEALKNWCFYGIFDEFLKNLNRAALFQSPVHGEGHIERTMLHGAFAAMDNDLSEEDTRLLLTMCSYHDTGRLSDWLDDAHGLSSTFKLPGLTAFTGEYLEMMKAGIEAHSRADKDMDEILSQYAVSDMDRTRRLAKFLKDSDGLDRVRISDLDTKFLRNDAAVKRAEFSKFMFDVYTAELEALGRDTGKKRDYFDKDLVTGVRDAVHEGLMAGKCAYEIVISELCRLLDADISVSTRKSCDNSKAVCGCYNACMAFIGEYTGNDDTRLNEFSDSFMKQYKSKACGTLRPAGIRENDPVHICAALILDTTLFAYRFLTAEN